MPDNKPSNNLYELAKKWLTGSITDKEKTDYDAWYNSFDDTRHETASGETEKELEERLLHSIREKGKIGDPKVTQIRVWARIAAAASVLILLSIGTYVLVHKAQPQQTAQNQQHDIAPGGNKAILTLANGSKIVLTTAKNGRLAKQEYTVIQKTADGQLAYHTDPSSGPVKGSAAGMQYNTITTPRGGKYTLILADGTVAYLDAASSIRYPVAFNGKDRKVEITGQVYFEVVHDPAKPFSVIARGETVEDIGTHFNINVYDDEREMATTVLEGSVKVSAANRSAMLKPGQQAILSPESLTVKTADTEQVIAWKNGDFIFNSENLGAIMRQLSRWYDIEVTYKDKVEHLRFGGLVSRSRNISAVLAMMENTGKIHFQINGRRVMVIAGK